LVSLLSENARISSDVVLQARSDRRRAVSVNGRRLHEDEIADLRKIT